MIIDKNFNVMQHCNVLLLYYDDINHFSGILNCYFVKKTKI